MTGKIREISGLLGKIFLSFIFANNACADTVFNARGMAPMLGPNNAADPQVKLAGAIMLLFAGSLSILAFGYVFDSTRLDDRSTRS
jgi:hypothetical protein